MKRRRDLTDMVKKIMKLAQEEAKNNSDRELRPEHILLAILNEEQNKSNRVLKFIGIDTSLLYDLVSQHLRHTSLNYSFSSTTKSRLPHDPNSNKIMKLVDRESEKMGDVQIDTTHILLSLLSEKDLDLVKLLKLNKLNYKIFKEGVINYNTNPRERTNKNKGDGLFSDNSNKNEYIDSFSRNSF